MVIYKFSSIYFWVMTVLIIPVTSFSQELVFSAPQKVTAGYAKVEVLGRNSQGILVREIGRSDDQIAAYYSNLQQRWKKTTPRKEKNAKLEQIVVYDDSLIFFYSIIVKNLTLLKAFKTNAKLESMPLAVVCDTINHSLANTSPAVYFTFTPDKNRLLVYYEDAAFHNNDVVHTLCLDAQLHSLWKHAVKIKSMETPSVAGAVIDANGNACLVMGENTLKNFNNDFVYEGIHTFSIHDRGARVVENVFEERNHYLGTCQVRLDVNSGNVIMAGLYAGEATTESEGAYFFVLNGNDSTQLKKFEPHTPEFLAQLTGNVPRKSDGFYDFQPKELVITRNGGAILVTESESVSSESYTSNNYGTFGISSGFTVNYYHYDDVAVISFKNDGTVEWKQILHKKQGTEGDGGYYSSFATVIAPEALHFIYNDVANGQTSVAGYSIDVNGKQQRTDIFNADRKGVMLIPQSARQISPNEVLLPSLKRNYLQFVKISF